MDTTSIFRVAYNYSGSEGLRLFYEPFLFHLAPLQDKANRQTTVTQRFSVDGTLDTIEWLGQLLTLSDLRSLVSALLHGVLLDGLCYSSRLV